MRCAEPPEAHPEGSQRAGDGRSTIDLAPSAIGPSNAGEPIWLLLS